MRKTLLSAAIFFCLGAPAYAGPFNLEPQEMRLYISGFAGGSILTDADIPEDFEVIAGIGDPVNVTQLTETPFDRGLTFGGAIGLKLPFKYFRVLHPRIEGEVSYSENDTPLAPDGIDDGTVIPLTGEQSSLTVFFNSYNDIRISDRQIVVPYFGGGIGFADLEGTQVRAVDNDGKTEAIPNGLFLEDRVFAGHIAAGVTFEFFPNLDIYGEGRYFRFRSVRYQTSESGTTNLDGFNIIGGVRWKF